MCRARTKADSRATVLDVITADGEVFPVKRKLLRQCISLTHAVRDTQQATVHLESVDTPVFDRHAAFPCTHPYSHAYCLVRAGPQVVLSQRVLLQPCLNKCSGALLEMQYGAAN